MRKITRKALTTTAVAASAIALTALPAMADPGNIGITLPGVTTSPQPITGVNNGIVAAAAESGGVMTCSDTALAKALVATGTVKVGSTVTNPVGSVTDVEFNNCVVNNIPAEAVANVSTPWSLKVTDVSSSGVTPGALVGVDVTVTIPSLSCTARFAGNGAPGQITGEHTDPANPGDPSQLSLPFGSTNNLVASGVTAGCPSNIVQNGDTAIIAGVIDLTGDNATANEGPTVLATP
ncbi:hypothetical protein SAMN05443665_101259 [Actinomadura meyerae]|uniref:Neocarzinostatin family protein n=1 Tax=Actinomadura meyerae TaxID=240840 RepID=A0A239IC39_9ACTN|nr:hypothetical protein [Actinomadura meyerae]SNS91089.1 hypothetical protein SAMN05443665_101259 [Actinomadura meyerae]